MVTSVGPNAIGPLGPIKEGDEVIAYRIEGAYASRVVVTASSIVPKPARLNWAQAGSMMLTGTTAFHCLAATAVRSNETVLIHGAAGAVGRFAVQLAKISGATVVGTCLEKDADLIVSSGATPVMSGPDLPARIRVAFSGEIDAVIDTVGSAEVIDASLALVKNRSRIAIIVNLLRARKDGFLALGGESGHDEAIRLRDNALYVIAALAQSSALDVHVDRCFPYVGPPNFGGVRC